SPPSRGREERGRRVSIAFRRIKSVRQEFAQSATTFKRRNTMEFGLHLPASSSDVKSEDLIRFARQAEALGFYCITVADHVVVPRNISIPYPYTIDGKYPGTGYHLETLTTMSFLAGATQRIRFVTSVMIAPYR